MHNRRNALAAAAALVLVSSACGDLDEAGPELSSSGDEVPWESTGLSPAVVDPIGGSRVRLEGSDLVTADGSSRVASVTVGAVSAVPQVAADGSLWIDVGAQASGEVAVVAFGVDGVEQVIGTALVWSPAEIEGARLFDAASGVATGRAGEDYEWQRLTAEIASDWIVRDGNTLNWIPATGRY
jgi:hypothetical protein